jgi:RHS repeat-associated protein
MDDGDNQREITGEDPDDILMAEYRYDALHRRIAKIVPNGENWDRTDYYYTPGGQVAEERFEDAQANKETPAVPRNYQYVWDIRYIHAAVLRDADTDSDGDVLDSGGSERLYYTQDANFNVTALVETDGDIAERYVYDPYGKRTIYDDDWSDEIAWANSKKNEILFTGHRLNVESGLYYAGARYYDPTLGYWIGREAEYANGLNLYQYVESNPCRFTDPDGLAIYDTTNMPMREGPRGDIPVELPADAPDSAGSVAGIKKDAYTPTLSEAALEALATSSATAYVECVCKCGMAMNDKAEAFVKKHAAEAAAAAAAEAAAAAASTPVGKGYAAPGDVQSTSLATKIAVRTGMGTSPAVYHGMRILGRVGYYPVVITAVGIGLAELGVEGWCAYQCAKDTNFRVGS